MDVCTILLTKFRVILSKCKPDHANAPSFAKPINGFPSTLPIRIKSLNWPINSMAIILLGQDRPVSHTRANKLSHLAF